MYTCYIDYIFKKLLYVSNLFFVKLASEVDSCIYRVDFPYAEVDSCKTRVDPTESVLCRVDLTALMFFEESTLALEKSTLV